VSPQRLYRWAAGSSVALVLLFLVLVYAGLGGPLVNAFDDLAIAAAALAAGLACLHSANRGQYGFGRAWTIALRRAWRLLGAAALSWGAGQLIWSWRRSRCLRLGCSRGRPRRSARWRRSGPCSTGC
jgi:hypothetical protein